MCSSDLREENEEVWPVADRTVLTSWHPWPDVHIETLLMPFGEDGRWHIRAHGIMTERKLWTAEGGFCIPLGDAAVSELQRATKLGAAYAASQGELRLCAGIHDPKEDRAGEIVIPDPNTHLLWPRTALPTLRGALEPGGRHWLVTAVFAGTGSAGDAEAFANPPTIEQLERLGIPYDAFTDPV